MGWIRGRGGVEIAIPISQGIPSACSSTKGASEHVEDVNPSGLSIDKLSVNPRSKITTQRKYRLQPLDISDEDLPFIPPGEISSKSRPGARSGQTSHIEEKRDYWIVVDNIVYDCTSFISEHPGGEQVILSFVGEDCSWQFWRFHGNNEMQQFGKELRIGRTIGIANRFKEPVRFVGLSKLGSDDW